MQQRSRAHDAVGHGYIDSDQCFCVVVVVQKKYEVVAYEDEASVVVSVSAAAAAAGFVTCIIHVTSALMRTHPFHHYNGLSSLSLPP